MNFLGVGNLELLVICVLALLILGPRRLILVARVFGTLIGNIRGITENLPRYAEEFLEEDEKPANQSSLAIPPPPAAQPRVTGTKNDNK
jgi:Sec-independent protein translocase protein TatA